MMTTLITQAAFTPTIRGIVTGEFPHNAQPMTRDDARSARRIARRAVIAMLG